jgi:hypothetical protein
VCSLHALRHTAEIECRNRETTRTEVNHGDTAGWGGGTCQRKEKEYRKRYRESFATTMAVKLGVNFVVFTQLWNKFRNIGG